MLRIAGIPTRRSRSTLFIASLSAGLLLAVAGATLLPIRADAASTSVAPGSLTTTSGSTGGQGVAALATKDLSGTTDTWSKYVELGGASGAAYSGYADFTLPAGITPSSVTGLGVSVNYRGPAAATQTWAWDLYNYATSSWARIGTNASAPDWGAWTLLTFTAPGTASAYVSSGGAARVRMTSSNAVDDADIDYLALTVTSGTAPTGTTTPTTTTRTATTAPTTSTRTTTTAPTTSTRTTTTAPTTTTGTTSATATQNPGITLPQANGVYDYQINGPYTPASAVTMVGRDRTDSIAAGKYNVCYINAYQAQPDEQGSWPATLILKDASGKTVVDGEWNEVLLDTSTAAKRQGILDVVSPWMQQCKDKGFKGLEMDNLDSWTRSKNLLTQSANVEMAKLYVAKAHALGLAIAQKNTPEIASIGRTQIGFDFAVVEECQATGECTAFTDAYGNQVYEIEYDDNGGVPNFQKACTARGSKISITYRDRQVVPLGDQDYAFQYC